MAIYMTQKMSSGALVPITYYRKQSQPHVSHTESGAFTTAATNAYAAARAIPVANVVAGAFKSGQGVPTGGETDEI